MAIKQRDIPRIREVMSSLDNLAQIRKELLDQLWVNESVGEQFRIELMHLLDRP